MVSRIPVALDARCLSPLPVVVLLTLLSPASIARGNITIPFPFPFFAPALSSDPPEWTRPVILTTVTTLVLMHCSCSTGANNVPGHGSE
jgi:hypothetical protein